MYTITFTEQRMLGVQAAIDAYNIKTGKTVTIEQYLQARANELADQAIYDYKIPPTRDEFTQVVTERDTLKAENKALKDELAVLRTQVPTI